MAKPSSKQPTLWGLHFSPWTEKARWALDFNEVDYRYREHMPMIGELPLRWHTRAREKGQPASVPVLLDELGAHPDSELIARRAELLGKGAGLFPEHAEDSLREWSAKAQTALENARALIIHALANNDLAQIEGLPPAVPGVLRRPLRRITRSGANFLARKYVTDTPTLEGHLAELSSYCAALGAALGERDHMVGDTLSYVDMVCAVALNGMNPPAHLFRRKPASRAVWTRDAIVDEFAPLFAWRDRLYERHRGLPPRRPRT